ncbi:unnamed protein product [Prorocentrum cordatum]|uniref:Uncharacterized protein n=1 Tax=Prorocentrum cordatum TaxID=2364126 RepID=A0ABN9UW85_9DINO|nr:unnamed protein product [Polarella glacialis]
MQDIVGEAGGHACSAVAMRVCFPFPAPLILVSLKSCASRVWRFAPSPAVAPSGPLGLALEALGPTGSVGLGLLFAFIGPAAHSSHKSTNCFSEAYERLTTTSQGFITNDDVGSFERQSSQYERWRPEL